MMSQNSSISSFKKFTLRILIPYLGSIILLGLGLNYFFEEKIIFSSEISGAYKVNRMLKETFPQEVPIFGSSRAEGGIIPDSVIKNGFNYGISGTQDNVLLFLLRKECSKNKTNPILINFDLHGLSYVIGDPANYIPNAYMPEVEKLMASKFKAIYRIPLLKYYGNFETYTKYYFNDKLNLTKYTNKGAAIEKNILPKKKFDELVKKRLGVKWKFENSPDLQKDLEDLIKKNNNRKFVFFVAPYHSSCFPNFENPEAATNYLNELRKNKNVLVFDLSRMDYPDEYFINTSHLNLNGAIAFNRSLRDSLRKYDVK